MAKCRDMYEAYNKDIDRKINKATAMLHTINETISYVESQVKKCSAILNLNGYSVESVLNYTFLKDNNSKTIARLALSGNEEEIEKVRFYLVQRYLLDKRLSNITVYLNTIKDYKVPYPIFFNIISTYNESAVEQVLNGTTFSFGNNIGDFYILRKERVTHIDPAKGTVTRNIDWHNSKKYKEQLIAEGKTPYNKNTAPDGVKWFLYHNEPYTFWYTWVPSANLKNRGVARFVPTNFINTPSRSHEKYLANLKDIQTLITSKYLGNRDKLTILVKYDPVFALRYRQLNLN